MRENGSKTEYLRDIRRYREVSGGGAWHLVSGFNLAGQFPFPVRFKRQLNISVGTAGLRLLLCRFCVFPLSVGAIPVVGSGWLGRLRSSGAGAVVSAAGEALLLGREGVYQGVAEKQGVSLAQGIGLYTHIPSPPPRTCSTSAGSYAGAPYGGVAEKGGGGFYVEHYENN